jgi:hypothetical protein
MIGVSARPFSKSLSSHIQQMGRVMRSHTGKDFALWLDHSGNYLRFREDWEDVYENGINELDDGREKTKPEPTTAEKEAAKCPKCSHVWPSEADTCPCCGYVRERRNTVTSVPGVMEELGGSNIELQKQRDFYAQLLSIGSIRGYQSGWAYHKFIEKFNKEPKFRGVDPLPPTLEVMNWVRSRNIKWAKGRKKVAA